MLFQSCGERSKSSDGVVIHVSDRSLSVPSLEVFRLPQEDAAYVLTEGQDPHSGWLDLLERHQLSV